MIYQDLPLTFGRQQVLTTLTLTASEQYSNQIGIMETAQHDLRVKYVPLTTNNSSVKLEIRVYVSSDGTAVLEEDSTWFPLCYDVNDGSGNYDPVVRVFRSPALLASILKRNPNRSFPAGAKKIRMGFLEAGSPGVFGSIAEAFLASRPDAAYDSGQQTNGADSGSGSSVTVTSVPLPDGSSAVGDGTLTVTTAGVPVQFPTVSCKRVRVTAHQGNGSGVVVVGGATVVAALAGRRGVAYFPSNGDWHYVSNLNLLYADATVNGCRLHYYYET